MSAYPTIKVNPSNIIGDGDGIYIIASPEFINDMKEDYGIDFNNKQLLARLKKFGSLNISASPTRALLDNLPTEEELDFENNEKPTKNLTDVTIEDYIKNLPEAELPKEVEVSKEKGGYCSYSYDQVADWINCARSYVCDITHGMNSKETKQVLLQQTLELLDLLKSAFKDSKNVLNSPEFRINQ